MIAVTGGLGFIGSNTIDHLNKKGITDILVIDDVGNSDKYKNITNLSFVDLISKNDFISNLSGFNNIELIIHQGACSDTTNYDGNYLYNNNYEYTKKLIEYCISKNKRIIYASSASVYGNGSNGFIESVENMNPLNHYAFSKYLTDFYVFSLLKSQKTLNQVTGLRYFNVFGYQENHKGRMASVPFHLFHQAVSNNRIKIFEGSEDFFRDFIFIEDLLKILDFFIENKVSGIYNAGTGEVNSFMTMAEIIKSYFKGNIEIETIPFPEDLKNKYQKFTKADLSNLRSTGFTETFMSFEKSIFKYLNQLISYNGYLSDKS